jgi:hypothetical protein
MEQRVVFFLGAAAAAIVLYPAAPADLRWVAALVAVTYLVLAGLAALDGWSRRRRR